ncbi:MAG: hypothetical protein M5U34_28235 [Chloroflexi bacterium]|nr:hypothetical protein [Chloroflexota bacterium]
MAPLLNRDKQRIGLISLDEPLNERRPDPRTFQIIELYAQFAASAIENRQLVTESQSRSADLENILQANDALSSTLEEETILTTAGRHMSQAAHAIGYRLYRWQPQSHSLLLLDEEMPGARPSAQTAVSLSTHSPLWRIINNETIYTPTSRGRSPPAPP